MPNRGSSCSCYSCSIRFKAVHRPCAAALPLYESMPASALSVDHALTPTVAEVRLDHLRHNVRLLMERAAPTTLMAVVKADAYGHGAERVATVCAAEGIAQFGVATVGEGMALREAGIEGAILVLGAPLPGALAAYRAHRLEVNVCSTSIAEAVCQVATASQPLRVHVKADTGMSRLGLAPHEVAPVLAQLRATAGVDIAGLWSHYATATSSDDSFARMQRQQFQSLIASLPPPLPPLHIGHSGGLLTEQPETLHADTPTIVRPGLALYGVPPSDNLQDPPPLRPVMRLVSRVTQVKTLPEGATVSYGRTWTAPRPTRLAIVGIGYADGYPRALSNRGFVGLLGERYPIVGAVCMDMCMVDLGSPASAPDVTAGDDVILFGDGGPSLGEVAGWAGTIPYEICTRVGPRVPKVYI